MPTFEEVIDKKRPAGVAWQAYVSWAGADGAGRPLFAPVKTPRDIVQALRDGFSRLESDKEFRAELTRVAGDDAELLAAKDAEAILRQLLTASPGVQDFVKNLTKEASAKMMRPAQPHGRAVAHVSNGEMMAICSSEVSRARSIREIEHCLPRKDQVSPPLFDLHSPAATTPTFRASFGSCAICA